MIFLHRVWGMCKIVAEIPEWWGVILVVKQWKFQGGRGLM